MRKLGIRLAEQVITIFLELLRFSKLFTLKATLFDYKNKKLTLLKLIITMCLLYVNNSYVPNH